MKTFLIVLTASLTLLVALTLSIGLRPSKTAAQDLPYTFFFTHYELLGDPNNPDGVRYHSNGHPSAKAPDGSKVILQVRAAGTQRQTSPRAVVTILSRAPRERSKLRDHGE